MRKWHVRWSRWAAADVNAIADYIAVEDPQNAEAALERLYKRASSLDCFPERGRKLREFETEGSREYRDVIERPWRLLYWMEAGQVQIIAVVDGRRDFAQWLQQERSTRRLQT